jgi:putative ABC transport system ATP-binding protein
MALASAGSRPLVELWRVSKDYDTGGGTVRAMRDVSVSIAQGEFVAIVGASGSGKSTMMNVLGCLDRPTHGTYTLAGIDVGGRPGDSRAIVRNQVIGFVFQGFNLLPRTTARENVELPLQYRGVRLRERRKRARAALEAVGLGDRMDHTPNQLSGGQQQRVAIARALVTDPPLLLADEPTGNLDTRTSLEVLALLQRLNRQRGITVVLVTHESDIAACASRVITMRDGRIVSDVAQETPSDAGAALGALSKLEEDAAASANETSLPAPALVGPLPVSVFAAMFVGELLGEGTGAAYASLGLGWRATWTVAAAIAIAEITRAWAGARWARRVLRRPASRDQRVRMAFWYTVSITFGLGGALFAVLLRFPVRPTTNLGAVMDAMTGALSFGPVSAVVVILSFAALLLLRYLLITLFNPRR